MCDDRMPLRAMTVLEGKGERRSKLMMEPLTFLSRERAFLDAARQFAVRAKRSQRSGGDMPVALQVSGETACVGIQVLEALAGFHDRDRSGVDIDLVSSRAGLSREEVHEGLACLRRTRIIARDSHAIDWQRFGAGRFDAELSRRVLGVWEALPENLDFAHDAHGWIRGSMVLLRIASFGGAAGRGERLALENLALLSRHDGEATRAALVRLRDHGLVQRRALGIRIEGLARLEATMR